MSSSASPEPSQKDHGSTGENSGVSTNGESVKADAKVSAQPEDSGSGESDGANQMKESGSISESQSKMSQTVKRRRRGTKRTAFSDSDSEGEGDLSMDDLVKLVAEKEELLKLKHKEIEKMQDKVLRSYAEMENVMDRTRREAESTKKFAIQVFCVNICFHTRTNFILQFFCAYSEVLFLPDACFKLFCRILQRIYWMLQII